MKAVEAKVDEVGVVFDREEERKELAPITVISTISLEVNTLKTPLRCHHHHLNVTSTISLFLQEDNTRDSTGRRVIEVTKEFHEISISDTETESELNTTNEETGEEVRRGEKEKVRMEEEETDAAPPRQMAMPKVALPQRN